MHSAWSFCRSQNLKEPYSTITPVLHDRYATDAFVEDGRLVLDFNDGFVILPTDETNEFNECKLTTRSRIEILLFSKSVEDDVVVHLLKRHRFFRGCGFTTVSNIDADELIDNIHSGRWKLEFIYHYEKPLSILFKCAIHRKRRYYDCEVEIDAAQINYYWNETIADSVV